MRRVGGALISIGVAVVLLAVLFGVLAQPSGSTAPASSRTFTSTSMSPNCVAAWHDLPHFDGAGVTVHVPSGTAVDLSGEGPTFLCPQDWASVQSR